jgi:F-type H+-transporting ATPase subunit a
LPYFLTAFFFILVCNLLGLVPYGSTATGNISVTAGMAILSFFVIQGVAIRDMGLGGWIKHLTGGVHWALWPIMIPVEIMGLFTKPFALCVRLFANMTAGHVVILSILGLIFIFHSVAVAGLAVPFSVFIYLLEILVAFIQAYVFTMLSAVFAGLGVHASHGEEHAETH